MNPKQLGDEFLKFVRAIYRNCEELPNRRPARLAAFAICVMLDGSGESFATPDYRVCLQDENGDWQPLDFFHHDL